MTQQQMAKPDGVVARKSAALIENLQHLADAGVGITEAADRVDRTSVALERWLYRYSQRELMRKLRRNEPKGYR